MAVTTDVLVLGSGVAGLTFALHAAKSASVTVISKRAADQGSTAWAQGGISSVQSPDDSFDKHIADTHVAGAGLCHDVVVELCVREAPAAIHWLLEAGVELSRKDDGSLALGREGGHSERRVAHAGDITGAAVENVLLSRARENPNIQLLEWHMGVDLITMSKFGGPDRCVGAYVLDEKTGNVEQCLARATVLATGGAGKVYLYTSNPDVATGDGVAMAYRAGAAVANMEFFQFHPTCLFHPQAKSFLISEALRGEGGILRNGAGEAFMSRYDARKELAPRDVVARSIDAEMKRRGDDCAVLDMTHLPKSFLVAHFPNIYATCKEFGIDMAVQPIPA